MREIAGITVESPIFLYSNKNKPYHEPVVIINKVFNGPHGLIQIARSDRCYKHSKDFISEK